MGKIILKLVPTAMAYGIFYAVVFSYDDGRDAYNHGNELLIIGLVALTSASYFFSKEKFWPSLIGAILGILTLVFATEPTLSEILRQYNFVWEGDELRIKIPIAIFVQTLITAVYVYCVGEIINSIGVNNAQGK